MQSFFSRLLWAFILLVFQGLVFNHIHFFGYATPVHDFDGLVRSATFAVVYAQRLSGRHGAGLPDVGRMELHLVCDVTCTVAAGVRDDA